MGSGAGRPCAVHEPHVAGAWLTIGAYLPPQPKLRTLAMAINPTDLSHPGDAHVGSYWAATAGPDPRFADMEQVACHRNAASR